MADKVEYKRKIVFEERNRISNGTAILMLGLAILVDLSMALLMVLIIGFILNPLLTPFIWLTYYVWYKIKDVGLFDKLLRFAIMSLIPLIEITPFGILPTWTVGVALMIWSVRVDDKIYNQTKGIVDANAIAKAAKERDTQAIYKEGQRVIALRQRQKEEAELEIQLENQAKEREEEMATQNEALSAANDNRPQFGKDVENQIANDNRPQYNRDNGRRTSQPEAA